MANLTDILPTKNPYANLSLSDFLFFDPTEPPGALGYSLATIGSIFLAIALLGGLTLLYITIRHGYGSTAVNILVMNWALCSIVYGITHSALNNINQYFLRKWWPFGFPACIASMFLENFCVLPLDTIPTIICVYIFRQVYFNREGGKDWIARIPIVIWISMGVWIIIIFCTLGSIYEGKLLDMINKERLEMMGIAVNVTLPVECTFGLTRDTHRKLHVAALVEMFFETVVGSFIPLIIILIVGIKTIMRTWGTRGNLPSPLYGKVKVRQLLLSLMGIMVIHYIWMLAEFFNSGFASMVFIPRTSIMMSVAATLTLVFCHEEFLRTLPCRAAVADDTRSILPRLSFSKSQEEQQDEPKV